MFFQFLRAGFTFAIVTAASAFAAVTPSTNAVDFKKFSQRVRLTLEQMVASNTSNPPGNEAKIVKLAAARLKTAKIPFEITEFAPGRQNIVARLKGSGAKKPILLLAHIDVVGTDKQDWTVPKHKLTEKDGYLWGRGVLDDLVMAATSLETLILLKESKVKLNRDVIVALTGDEESGGAGIQYILKNKPASIQAAFALNEGGGIILNKEGRVEKIDLQVAEKIYQDFELTVKGTTGHSSVPLKDNAIARLGLALGKLGKYQRPARLLPVTRAYFEAQAHIDNSTEAPAMLTAMKKIVESKGTLPSKAVAQLETNPIYAALLRTTCVATMISGGTRVNSLPAEAKANINCRILPDEDTATIQADLARVIDDSSITIRSLEPDTGAPASSLEDEAPRAILKTAQSFWPQIVLIPTLSKGATDSRFLRNAGIPAYGINPIPVSEEDLRRSHGIDERLPVESIRVGAEYFHRLLLELALAG